MYTLNHSCQVLAVTLPCLLLILLQLPSNTQQQPLQRTIRDTTTGRLSVSVVSVLGSVNAFLEKTSHPERSIELENRKVDSSVRTTHAQTHSREPTWFSKHGTNNFKKMKRRSRRKRQKRGAKINHDAAYISEYPTNNRVYKYCNRLGFFLRLNEDGTVDGTKNIDDPNTVLLFESHGRSIIRIKGYNANRYLTMTDRGVPSAERDPHYFNSLFRLTAEETAWETIASYKYYFDEKFDMLVGITKDATLKQPWKASPGQYATQFLPLPSKLPIQKTLTEDTKET